LTESYSLTGTAFDYLIRWYVKKLNPHAFDRKRIAESTLSVPAVMEQQAALNNAKQIVLDARRAYSEYLSGKSQAKPGEQLITHAIRLGQLDSVFGTKALHHSTFGPINAKVTEDLTRILDLVNPAEFLAHEICVLNPVFGDASKLVGGADGDLILDETLIEFKTTKALELERETFNQLLGYYLLSQIGGISGCPRPHYISRVAVYYSRYGVLWGALIRQVIDEKRLPELISWFREVAETAKTSK